MKKQQHTLNIGSDSELNGYGEERFCMSYLCSLFIPQTVPIGRKTVPIGRKNHLQIPGIP